MSVSDLFEKARAFLFRRQRAYQLTFGNPMGEQVLRDLAKFCRAHEPTFHPDPRVAAQLDGRREVWLRIQAHLNLSSEDLWKLYGKPEP